MTDSVTILSGGLDSSVLSYHLKKLGYSQTLLTFDYGQRHRREIESAKEIAKMLGAEHSVIDLTSVGRLLTGSALTDSQAVDVPEGHYTAESMSLTVVPNRNAIMLSVAWGVACARRAHSLAYAAHAGDHAIYPDCRPGFVDLLTRALQVGTDGCRAANLTILPVFIDWTKADIVRLGHTLKVPFELTWSCYKGGEVACGRCGTCVERLEAFHLADLRDPLEYRDPNFWKTVTKGKQHVHG